MGDVERGSLGGERWERVAHAPDVGGGSPAPLAALPRDYRGAARMRGPGLGAVAFDASWTGNGASFDKLRMEL